MDHGFRIPVLMCFRIMGAPALFVDSSADVRGSIRPLLNLLIPYKSALGGQIIGVPAGGILQVLQKTVPTPCGMVF